MELISEAGTSTLLQHEADLSEALEKQHVYGNFRSYYDFHPAETRMTLLPEGCFRIIWERSGSQPTFHLLDVGCNEGDLSMALFARARSELPSHVRLVLLGIDIDPTLIERANAKFQGEGHDKVSFSVGDVLSEVQLARAFAGLGDPSPLPLVFHFISLFSVIMWLHINHGTAGLMRFLDRISRLVSPLGSVLVEIQGAKSYKTAAKRCRKLGLSPPPFKIEREFVENVEALIVGHLCRSGDPSSALNVERRLGHESWQDRPVYLLARGRSVDT